MAKSVAYGSGNPKVNIIDTGLNPTTTNWFCVLRTSCPGYNEKLLGSGYVHKNMDTLPKQLKTLIIVTRLAINNEYVYEQF